MTKLDVLMQSRYGVLKNSGTPILRCPVVCSWAIKVRTHTHKCDVTGNSTECVFHSQASIATYAKAVKAGTHTRDGVILLSMNYATSSWFKIYQQQMKWFQKKEEKKQNSHRRQLICRDNGWVAQYVYMANNKLLIRISLIVRNNPLLKAICYWEGNKLE